jgi:hypothetical protein
MTVNNLSRFWQAIESLPSLAAVTADWELMVGDEFALVRPFLRPRPERAESFPRPNGLPYEVVEHGGSEFVGVCHETGNTLALTSNQLVIYELDRERLAGCVADMFGINRTGAGSDRSSRLVHLGWFTSAASTRYACLLAFPIESNDVHAIAAQLIAEGQAPFILFAPTRQWARRHVQTHLKFHGCVFVSLVEVVSCTIPGRLEAKEFLDTAVARATGVVSVVAGVPTPEPRRNVFQLNGDVWTLTFSDKTLQLRDRLGLRYIAHLIGSKGREVEAAVLKAGAKGAPAVKPSAGTEILDRQGFEACRADYEDLVEQLEEAKGFNDVARQEQLQGRLNALAEQLKAAQGFGGRRRKVGDESASVRTSVKNAISGAIEQIQKKHADLARHLDTFISTGHTLCYSPHPDVDWDL